jgi:hypothetical protein
MRAALDETIQANHGMGETDNEMVEAVHGIVQSDPGIVPQDPGIVRSDPGTVQSDPGMSCPPCGTRAAEPPTSEPQHALSDPIGAAGTRWPGAPIGAMAMAQPRARGSRIAVRIYVSSFRRVRRLILLGRRK